MVIAAADVIGAGVVDDNRQQHNRQILRFAPGIKQQTCQQQNIILYFRTR